MAQLLREYLDSPSEKYKSHSYIIGKTSEIGFSLSFYSPEYSSNLPKAVCKASMEPFPRFRLYSEIPEIQILPLDQICKHINKVNRSQAFGYLKYQLDPVPCIFISYSIDSKLYDHSTRKSFFLETLDCLVDQFHQSIKEMRVLCSQQVPQEFEESEENSEDYEQSDNCEECGENWNCECSNGLDEKEQEIQVYEEITPEKYKTLFDFDESFYDNGIYFYSPSNTLENRLKEYPVSKGFLRSFEVLSENMINHGLYFKKYPLKLLMVNLNEQDEIDKVSLAPAISDSDQFGKWFTKDVKGKKNTAMNKDLCNLVLKTSKFMQIKIEDFIDTAKFEYKELQDPNLKLGEGGFANVFKNRLNGRDVALKIPHLKKESAYESIEKIRNEFLIAKFMQSEYIVETYGLIKLPQKDGTEMLGIVFEYLEGNTLKKAAEKMNPQQVKNTMGKVAEGVLAMHKELIIHQDLKPSNIIMCGDKPKIIDLGFAVMEEFRQNLRGFTMEYADPYQLECRSPGRPADVWSFALTFCSLLLLKGNPYNGVISEKLFERANKGEKDYKKRENERRKKFLFEIKENGVRPPFEIIEHKLETKILEMLKSCLDIKVENRPDIKMIHEILECK